MAVNKDRMKTPLIRRSLLKAALALAALALLPPARGAEAFRLDSFTIDGGGGTCRGGEFSLTGTIGQPDAAVAQGNEVTMEAGYWHGVGIEQTPGAPQLRIRLQPDGTVVLAWPVGVTGFALEQTSTLGTSSWTPTLRPVLDTATEHTVTVPASGPVRCYRLRRTQP